MAQNSMATKFITTVEERLNLLPISHGQLIFVRDNRKIYHDYNGERIEYSSVLFLKDDNARLQLTSPIEMFYFVRESKVLWTYTKEDGWVNLTSSPKESVVFVDYANLPEFGELNTLYTTETSIYRWNGSEYIDLSKTYWEEF